MAPLLIQHPYEPNKLLLQGPGLNQSVEEDVKLLVSEKYPDFKQIVISDMEPQQVTDDGLPIYTKLLTRKPKARIPFFLKKQKCTDAQRNMWVTDRHSATCGVFLRAMSLSKEPARETIYALTAGHSLLSSAQCKQLAYGHDEVKSIWIDVVDNVKTDFRLSVAPHGYPPFEIREVPLINFRHYVPIDDSQLLWHEKFMADETILEVNQRQLRERGWTGDKLQSFLECTPIRGQPTGKVDIAGVMKIKDPKDIGRLLNARVICGGIAGTIRPHPTRINNKTDDLCKWKLAHHIAFCCEQP